MSRTILFRGRRPAHRRRLVKTCLQVERLEDRNLLSVDVLKSFAGLAFDVNNGQSPPDSHLAAGPTHIVEVVNSDLAFFDKSGRKLFEDSLSDFFAPVGANPDFPVDDPRHAVFDPKVSFDELAGRFIVTASDTRRDLRTSHVLVAVSDDADPRGAWEMHRLNVDENHTRWCDFPQLGWDADAIYVACNMQGLLKGNETGHVHVHLMTIQKSSMLDGNNTTLTSFEVDREWPHITMQPAVMHGARPGDPMYFVEATQANPGNSLLVVKMTNKLSAQPTFTDFRIDVPKYNYPPNATQPAGQELTTNFTWILNVAGRGNRLVASQTVEAAKQKVARARWYEFDIDAPQPTLVQSGEIDPGPGVHTYYPSIEVAANGDLGMTFMQSSTTEFMSMYVTGRRATDPAGVMQPPLLAKAGEATYRVIFSSGQELTQPLRTGDYSGITVDPVTGTFWVANEYATEPLPPPQTRANWGNWIANFSISRSGMLIVAGDPNGSPPDSPDNRVDPNTERSPFAGVGSLRMFRGANVVGGCSAAAIGPRHVLTAAHCVDFNLNGHHDGADYDRIEFALNLDIDGPVDQPDAIIPAARWYIHPDSFHPGNLFAFFHDDIAVIELSTPLPEGVPFYHLYADDLAGRTLHMVGYGRSGDGVNGFTTPGSRTVKRVGQNVADYFEGQDEHGQPPAIELWQHDFDHPTDPSLNVFGGPSLGNDKEANIGFGDSGGPAFVLVGNNPNRADSYRIGGIITHYDPKVGTFPLFGSVSGGTVVSAYLDWIQAILSGNASASGEGSSGAGEGGALISAGNQGSRIFPDPVVAALVGFGRATWQPVFSSTSEPAQTPMALPVAPSAPLDRGSVDRFFAAAEEEEDAFPRPKRKVGEAALQAALDPRAVWWPLHWAVFALPVE